MCSQWSCDAREPGQMAPDLEYTRKQTIAWLDTLPASRKNPKKMQMVIKDGKVTFVPIF